MSMFMTGYVRHVMDNSTELMTEIKIVRCR